ncbi:hypothetical protein J2Z79_002798 [Symbiobacterium terraclitae]|uniref:Uncharacterized protein n=1 Tax=Symbiobacterium terraclitae TaxID=557451 RepID=A0ABS4JV14_9FIRM|nr:hypothetical protein [Symbiobacterium terraclitae]
MVEVLTIAWMVLVLAGIIKISWTLEEIKRQLSNRSPR